MRTKIKHILTFPPLLLAVVILLSAVAMDADARTRTTRKNLRSTEVPIAVVESTDSLLPDSLLQVDPKAVTLKGYSKRASDNKESFFITVSLKPGETKLVSIKSFDVQRLFYYYAGPQPRKSATPFQVAFRLTGYDIPVGN